MNFKFQFEELSLLSQDGFNLRLEANGYAVIGYRNNGDWRILEIWLEGTRLSKERYTYDRKHFELRRGTYLYAPVYVALMSTCFQLIQDRIRDELNEHGISIPDPNREHLEVSAS